MISELLFGLVVFVLALVALPIVFELVACALAVFVVSRDRRRLK